MRTSEFHLATVKETPADAEIVSHQLMLRSGMIRRLAAGIYAWSPLGYRVLRKVEDIVREEMDRAGGLEMLMPAIQPAELWQESGRWEIYGGLLLRIQDRGDREYCFGPTHEEVITDFARNEIRSYKQLPVTYYQIQWKFRDEIRPRFGVMRAREFLMKDAYSFHMNDESLEETYKVMYDAYTRVFERMGLKFRAVQADPGEIGGSTNHEFMVLADSGEDAIAFCAKSDYAANVEKAEAVAPSGKRPGASADMKTVDTPGVATIEQLSSALKVAPEQCAKTLLVRGSDERPVALVVRGDHHLNEAKAIKLEQVASPLEFLDEKTIRALSGASPGSVGPVGLGCPVIADRSAAHMSNFVCGANEDGKHLTGVNWSRDLPEPGVADMRNVVEGDPSPDGKGTLEMLRGIEVGHVFQLGTKYSKAMHAVVLDENGKAVEMPMGCYGLGVSRTVAAAIEQNHDDNGIIWPDPIAPFQIALLPMNMQKSERLREATTALYDRLRDAGFDVLFDDRKVRPGVMFAEMELIGIPHRIVVSDSSLDNGTFEYRGRRDTENTDVPADGIIEFLKERIAS